MRWRNCFGLPASPLSLGIAEKDNTEDPVQRSPFKGNH